jgi:hypothetical protein
MLIDIQKILRVTERGSGAFREKLAFDQFGDFGRDSPRDLTTQSFKQLLRDPIHNFIDDAVRNDHALLRFIRNRTGWRLDCGAIEERVMAPDLIHGLYGCGIGEYVIQFQYVVHI